jgi:hypothetical protein
MIIRPEQIEAMRAERLQSMCTRLTQRLLTEKQVVGVDATELSREIPELIEDAAAIGVVEDEDVYRLLRFRYLSFPLLTSPLIQSVVIRVLHNLAWPAEKRLNFLERQVLPRVPPDAVETAGGPPKRVERDES